MKKIDLINAFNLWMDNYINHPEDFRHDFETVIKHLEEKSNGKPITYGERATEYLLSLIAKV